MARSEEVSRCQKEEGRAVPTQDFKCTAGCHPLTFPNQGNSLSRCKRLHRQLSLTARLSRCALDLLSIFTQLCTRGLRLYCQKQAVGFLLVLQY